MTRTSTLKLPRADVSTLRRLGEEIAAVSRLEVHREKAEMWRRLNDLEPVRPMVWINEIPWHEMNVDDELTLRCRDQWARELEEKLRQTLYQWRHMPADMIVNDYVECPLAIESTVPRIQKLVKKNLDVARVFEATSSFAERDGTYTNTERRVQLTELVVAPPGEATAPRMWSRSSYAMSAAQ